MNKECPYHHDKDKEIWKAGVEWGINAEKERMYPLIENLASDAWELSVNMYEAINPEEVIARVEYTTLDENDT